MNQYFRELLRRRDLIGTLVVSGLKSQHKNTLLGYFWWVLDPLLGVLVYYFLRVVLLGTAGENVEIFLAVGLVTWRWLKSVIPASAKCISREGKLITKVYLPKIIFPLSLNLTQMINYLFSIVIVLAFVVIFEGTLTWQLVWFPYVVFVQFLFLFALSLIFAWIGSFLKDIENIMSHIMRFWFYGSPVIWETSRLPQEYQWVVHYNPAAAFLNSFRNIFAYGRAPEFLSLNIIGGISLLVIFAMVVHYSKNEHKIIKAL